MIARRRESLGRALERELVEEEDKLEAVFGTLFEMVSGDDWRLAGRGMLGGDGGRLSGNGTREGS